VDTLRQFVSYRTVSSDIRYQADCRRGAYFLRDLLKSFGATTTSLPLQNPAWNPVILAKFQGNPKIAPKRKRILFYGHYDVIPAENESNRWNSDPFILEGINDHVYGRGASDNKGPILSAIYAVADLVANKELDSDIIFLIEGEEESGSRGFEQAIRANKKLIGDVDWILLANSYWLDDHNPCLTYGLRGVIHATVEVQSGHPDLHSGVDGSSLLDESLKDLVTLLAKLTGQHGKILIPGFYDSILPVTQEELALYEDIKRALITSNPSLVLQHNLAEELQKRWCDASLTIHRFYTSGPDNSTIIPRLAKASISVRLVPNQTAQEVAQSLTSFLHEQFEKLDSKNELTVNIDHMAEPWLGDYKNQIYKTLEDAVTEAWSTEAANSLVTRRRNSSVPATTPPLNALRKPIPATSSTLARGSMTPELSDSETELHKNTQNMRKPSSYLSPTSRRRKPLYIREGGSIPAIRFLEKEFNAPAAHFPCGQASDNAHLDNERLRLVNLYKSRDIFRQVFKDLPKK
jgi:di- and tripeptidase